MIENIPLYVPIVMSVCALYALYCIYQASNNSKTVLLILSLLLIVQSGLALQGFYLNFETTIPRFPLVLSPIIIAFLLLLFTKQGKSFLDSLDQKWLHILHIVRIPVELCLFWLFVAGMVPEDMTFEGRNFDILAGITAPIIIYLNFTIKKLSKKGLLIWNVVFMLFLLNIIATAILSLPLPFQQFGLDQPNTGILYFPFIFLPCFIAPAALFSHIIAIRKLTRE